MEEWGGGNPFNIENFFILFFLVSNEITCNIFVSMYVLKMGAKISIDFGAESAIDDFILRSE